MNFISEDDVTFAVDMAEVGIRPSTWFDEERPKSEFHDQQHFKFPHENTSDLTIFAGQFQTSKQEATGWGSTSDEDSTDFQTDPETGERIFQEVRYVEEPPADQWIEEYLTTLESSSSDAHVTTLSTDFILEGFDSAVFEEQQNHWLSTLIDFNENSSTRQTDLASNDILTTGEDSQASTIFLEDEINVEMMGKIEKCEPEEIDAAPIVYRRSSIRTNAQTINDQDTLNRFQIPLTVDQIAQSTTEEYNQYLIGLTHLTPEQIQIIKDIRRRGKNKIAAQNCRKRKAVGVESLTEEVDELKRIKQELERQRRDYQQRIAETRSQYECLHRQVLPHEQLLPAIVVK